MENNAMQHMNDDEMEITGGNPLVVLGGIAVGIEIANFAWDMYQGWSNYSASTPYVYSTITYY
jgi:hypothetical protein